MSLLQAVYKKQLKFSHLMAALVFLLFGGLVLVNGFQQLYTVIPVPIYLTIHTILEFFSVAMGTAVFIVAWYNFQQTGNRQELVVCLTFLAVIIVDFAHALSYKGMPDLFTPNSVNKASTFWVIARLIQAIGLLLAAFTKPGKSDRAVKPLGYVMFTVTTVIAMVVVIAYKLPELPPMFIVGQGQTKIKIFLDYLAIFMQGVALLYLLTRKQAQNAERHMEAALLFGIFSEVAFSMYESAFDTYNLIGHIYKIGAFICILRGFFVSSLVSVYETNKVLDEKRRRLSEINVQLEKVNKLKTDFLANTNHELRTPLTAIIAFTELLLDKETGPLNSIQKDYLQEINDSGHQLLVEINNLLDFTKIEAGQMKVQLKPMSLNTVVSQVIKQLVPLFQQRRQSIVVNIPQNLPVIHADGEKVKKILINLLSNAIKFSPVCSGIYLDAELSQDREFIIVRVTDTGQGLEPDQLSNLFERFSQITDMQTNTAHGTGLGLAIVKCLVELHQGSVWVDSKVGHGSTFSFSLPVKLPEKEAV